MLVSSSWDDGYRDTEVVEVFLDLGITSATFFPLTNKRTDFSCYLPFEVGNHTHTHKDLTMLSDEEVVDELRIANHILEDALQRPITAMAYPYGRVDERVAKIVQSEGFAYARRTYVSKSPNLGHWSNPFYFPTCTPLHAIDFWASYEYCKTNLGFCIFSSHGGDISRVALKSMLQRMLDNGDTFVTHAKMADFLFLKQL